MRCLNAEDFDVPEVILDGGTGIITSLEVQKITDALKKLDNDRELRAKMRTAA